MRIDPIILADDPAALPLAKFAAHHERVGPALICGHIVARSPTNLAEAQTAIKSESRRIGLINFEEERLSPPRMEFPQHSVHQLTTDAATAMGAGDSHREYLRFPGSNPSEDETDRPGAASSDFQRRVAEDCVLAEQRSELVVRPRPNEILAMKHRERGTVIPRERLDRVVPPSWIEERYAHQPALLGRAACGFASGSRR
jgi:hypothetical protein